jgi:DNA-directed RNA polymerase subunit beta'
MREEIDESTGLQKRVIIEHKEERLLPRIVIMGEKRQQKASYSLPAGAYVVVQEGEKVEPGEILAKIPRELAETKDITGGLPRVAELFEARRSKDPALIAEINGTVKFEVSPKGMRLLKIINDLGEERQYLLPLGKHLRVHEGDRVVAGDQLTEGPVDPHDILRVKGDKELQTYLVNEIQEVYRLQGVNINDKHVEVIIRQMLKKVEIEDPGDTNFLEGQQVDKFLFRKENERVVARKGSPATARPVLLGITRASLTTESFISAASFQETTRVLTEAAITGKKDELKGLKENVIIGRLIPAGTGMSRYRNTEVLTPGKPKEEVGELEKVAS